MRPNRVQKEFKYTTPKQGGTRREQYVKKHSSPERTRNGNAMTSHYDERALSKRSDQSHLGRKKSKDNTKNENDGNRDFIRSSQSCSRMVNSNQIWNKTPESNVKHISQKYDLLHNEKGSESQNTRWIASSNRQTPVENDGNHPIHFETNMSPKASVQTQTPKSYTRDLRIETRHARESDHARHSVDNYEDRRIMSPARGEQSNQVVYAERRQIKYRDREILSPPQHSYERNMEHNHTNKPVFTSHHREPTRNNDHRGADLRSPHAVNINNQIGMLSHGKEHTKTNNYCSDDSFVSPMKRPAKLQGAHQSCSRLPSSPTYRREADLSGRPSSVFSINQCIENQHSNQSERRSSNQSERRSNNQSERRSSNQSERRSVNEPRARVQRHDSRSSEISPVSSTRARVSSNNKSGTINPIALRQAKTQSSFSLSESNRVSEHQLSAAQMRFRNENKKQSVMERSSPCHTRSYNEESADMYVDRSESPGKGVRGSQGSTSRHLVSNKRCDNTVDMNASLDEINNTTYNKLKSPIHLKEMRETIHGNNSVLQLPPMLPDKSIRSKSGLISPIQERFKIKHKKSEILTAENLDMLNQSFNDSLIDVSVNRSALNASGLGNENHEKVTQWLCHIESDEESPNKDCVSDLSAQKQDIGQMHNDRVQMKIESAGNYFYVGSQTDTIGKHHMSDGNRLNLQLKDYSPEGNEKLSRPPSKRFKSCTKEETDDAHKPSTGHIAKGTMHNFSHRFKGMSNKDLMRILTDNSEISTLVSMKPKLGRVEDLQETNNDVMFNSKTVEISEDTSPVLESSMTSIFVNENRLPHAGNEAAFSDKMKQANSNNLSPYHNDILGNRSKLPNTGKEAAFLDKMKQVNSNSLSPYHNVSVDDRRKLSPKLPMKERYSRQSPYNTTARSDSQINRQSPYNTNVRSDSQMSRQSPCNTLARLDNQINRQSPYNTNVRSDSQMSRQSPCNTLARLDNQINRQSPYNTTARSDSQMSRKSPCNTSARSDNQINRQPPYNTLARSDNQMSRQSPCSTSARSDNQINRQSPFNTTARSDSQISSPKSSGRQNERDSKSKYGDVTKSTERPMSYESKKRQRNSSRLNQSIDTDSLNEYCEEGGQERCSCDDIENKHMDLYETFTSENLNHRSPYEKSRNQLQTKIFETRQDSPCTSMSKLKLNTPRSRGHAQERSPLAERGVGRHFEQIPFKSQTTSSEDEIYEKSDLVSAMSNRDSYDRVHSNMSKSVEDKYCSLSSKRIETIEELDKKVKHYESGKENFNVSLKTNNQKTKSKKSLFTVSGKTDRDGHRYNTALNTKANNICEPNDCFKIPSPSLVRRQGGSASSRQRSISNEQNDIIEQGRKHLSVSESSKVNLTSENLKAFQMENSQSFSKGKPDFKSSVQQRVRSERAHVNSIPLQSDKQPMSKTRSLCHSEGKKVNPFDYVHSTPIHPGVKFSLNETLSTIFGSEEKEQDQDDDVMLIDE